MGPTENLEKKLIEINSKVIKKFNELKDCEVGIGYVPSWRSYATLTLSNEDNIPRIFVGSLFLELSDEEGEAAIAHELGHYLHVMIQSQKKKECVKKWNYELLCYTLGGVAISRHKAERLMKWVALSEADADKKAAERGYGNFLISVLKKIVTRYGSSRNMNDTVNRIKHLEEKLKEEGV